jgi:hypothetical protein
MDDFRCIAATLHERPIKIAKLLPHAPSTIGARDAAKDGMGGVPFLPNPNGTMQPVLWRQRFSEDIVARMVTDANPTGDLTISDLELAATIAHHDELVQSIDLRECTTNSLHDNTAAVYWQRKGSTTTTTKAASYLLRLQALHQLYHHYVPRHVYLPGVMNAMADDCSRLWALSDSQLLSHFNATFPQINCWQFCSQKSEMLSTIASALSNMRSEPASFLHAPVQPTNQWERWVTFCRSHYLGPFLFDLVDPVPILLALIEHHIEVNQAIADMTNIPFFYILRPGEYTGTTNDGATFRLCNLQLWVGNQAVDVMHATEAQLLASTSASLIFITQKN